ncbi:2-keto-4-pentenoate hydratase [Rhodococcus opacus]|uniref:2-keto-4-pentenoate hydratase n=1 Tax=Rhodococcus opacus TaxID=37919 RepID=UPI00155AAD4E|nr:fumarylacetoacetate hydrolase family protein [Rhodococcus opacus]
MLTDIELHQCARALYDAERDREWIEPLSTTHPGLDKADAYRISTLVTGLKTAAGRRVVGHKVGLTSTVMRELVGFDEPDYGSMFDDWVVPESGTIPFSELNKARAEIELAFVLGKPLDMPRPTAADVIRATEFVLPSIEIVDSRFRVRGTVLDSIADAATCGRVVLGSRPRRLTDIDVRAVVGTLEIDGEVVATGTAAESMGSPVNAVAWLAATLHDFDVALQPGHVVLSGSFVRAPWLSAGQDVVARFEGCGSASVSIGRDAQ